MNAAHAEHSGATQGMAALQMAPAVTETPSAFAAMIEHQMLAHFELIQAAHTINGHTIIPRSLDTKIEFDQVLKALAYVPDAAEPWSILGLAPLEGPDISLNTIETLSLIHI
eukprot:9380808-Pyramimonas_sp.AAC.1